jgi:hypothetical protein
VSLISLIHGLIGVEFSPRDAPTRDREVAMKFALMHVGSFFMALKVSRLSPRDTS